MVKQITFPKKPLITAQKQILSTEKLFGFYTVNPGPRWLFNRAVT
jgi:hypothetical protein